eukprot:GFYU01016614.1.p1 GENE.GFYU01016614.1~~GFYU01016614.1.p1  ORF type:complete len:310 (-),score=16.48 GFYU01016614.1:27-956(-)
MPDSYERPARGLRVPYTRQCCCGCSLPMGVTVIAVWMLVSSIFRVFSTFATLDLINGLTTLVFSSFGIYGARNLNARCILFYAFSRFVDFGWEIYMLEISLNGVESECAESQAKAAEDQSNDFDEEGCRSYMVTMLMLSSIFTCILQIYFAWVTFSLYHFICTGELASRHYPTYPQQGPQSYPWSPSTQNAQVQPPAEYQAPMGYFYVTDPSGMPTAIVRAQPVPNQLPDECVPVPAQMQVSQANPPLPPGAAATPPPRDSAFSDDDEEMGGVSRDRRTSHYSVNRTSRSNSFSDAPDLELRRSNNLEP